MCTHGKQKFTSIMSIIYLCLERHSEKLFVKKCFQSCIIINVSSIVKEHAVQVQRVFLGLL